MLKIKKKQEFSIFFEKIMSILKKEMIIFHDVVLALIQPWQRVTIPSCPRRSRIVPLSQPLSSSSAYSYCSLVYARYILLPSIPPAGCSLAHSCQLVREISAIRYPLSFLERHIFYGFPSEPPLLSNNGIQCVTLPIREVEKRILLLS